MRCGLRADGPRFPGGATWFHGRGRPHVGHRFAIFDPSRAAAVGCQGPASGRAVKHARLLHPGRIEPGRHRLCHLHLRLHRPAQGRAHPAPRGGEFPQLDAPRARPDAGRRPSIRHHAVVRHLRFGNLPAAHHRRRNRDRHPRDHARRPTPRRRHHPPRNHRAASHARHLAASVGVRLDWKARPENPHRRRGRAAGPGQPSRPALPGNLECLWPHRDHDLVHGRPARRWRRPGSHRPPDRQHAGLHRQPGHAAAAGRHRRRTPHRRRRPGLGLSRTPRANGGPLHRLAVPLRHQALPHRRPRPLDRRRLLGMPRSHGSPGESPRLPHRAGRN